MSVNNELQTALIARLRDQLTMLPDFAGVKAVFFQVPQQYDDSQPYVTIYELNMLQDDTDNTTGFEVVATIHTWVQERTTAQTGVIMQAIYDALQRYDILPVTGYTVSGVSFESQTILRDPDGVTKHGVQRFRINVEPAVIYPPCN